MPHRIRASAALLGLLATLASPAEAQLLVATSSGIQRVSSEGQVQATLSSTAASVARRRDATHVVFLVEGRNELRELDLASGAERVVATLPGDVGLGCGGDFGSPQDPRPEPYLVVDHTHFAGSFAVDADRACFEVMDRNLNMASVIAQIEVDLTTGAVSSTITFSEHCGEVELAALRDLPCSALLSNASADGGGRASERAWTVDAGDENVDPPRAFLAGPGRARRPLAIAGPEIESVSPNGRWAVLGGNRDECDYIYRQLWLMDLRRGRVFPVPAPDAAWPAPLPPEALADATRVADTAFGAVGETSVRWIGRQTLVLGEHLLVRPGRATVALPGALIP